MSTSSLLNEDNVSDSNGITYERTADELILQLIKIRKTVKNNCNTLGMYMNREQNVVSTRRLTERRRFITELSAKIVEDIRELEVIFYSWMNIHELTPEKIEEEFPDYTFSSFQVFCDLSQDLLDQAFDVLELHHVEPEALQVEVPDPEESTTPLVLEVSAPEESTTPPVLMTSTRQRLVVDKIVHLTTQVDSSLTNLEKELSSLPLISIATTKNKLVKLELSLDGGSHLDGLIDEQYELSSDQSKFKELNDWRIVTFQRVEDLHILLDIEEQAFKLLNKTKLPAMINLEKQKVPKFSGDCLDYNEWRINWRENIHSLNLTECHELGYMKDNIPEKSRRSLYQVDKLHQAWEILDKLHGDNSLIVQLLKSKVKNMMPKSNIYHEILIEVFEEMQYLVKRLIELGSEDLLKKERDYITSVYSLLPSLYKLRWDEYDKKAAPTHWDAFMKFMSIQYDNALEKRIMDISLSTLSITKVAVTPKQCNNCSKKGHIAADCRQKKIRSFNTNTKPNPRSMDQGLCVICAIVHTWTRNGVTRPSNRLYDCPSFKTMSVNERADFVNKQGCCSSCLSWTHSKANCKLPEKSCTIMNGSVPCGGNHNGWLHSNTVIKLNYINHRSKLDHEVLLNMTEHQFAKDVSGIIFFDDGSSHNLILHSFAKKLNLKGRKVIQHMELTGVKTIKQDTILYEMLIPDNNRKKHMIYLFGMSSITSNLEHVDVRDVCKEFPTFTEESLRRPIGEVSLLIGMQEASLLPVCLMAKKNVRIMSCLFGTGYIMSGSHEKFRSEEVTYTPEVLPFLDSLEDTAYYSIDGVDEPQNKILSHYSKIPTYFEGEELAISFKQSTLCNPCQLNQEKLKERSILEEEELQLIKENVCLVKNQIVVKYPIIGDVSRLKDNEWQAIKIAKSVENKLIKTQMVAVYNKEFQGLIDRDTIREVTRIEIQDWLGSGGKINYISHHSVEKVSSNTTPLRIVWNSSLKNSNTGPSCNDLWPKGANSLNNLFKVFVNWRLYTHALVWDLSKAYNALRTGDTERFLRLCVWRQVKTDDDFKTYGANKVMFGDKPAANCLEYAKVLAANVNKEIDPETAHKIVHDSYVDDTLSGADDKKTIARMKGTQCVTAGNCTYTGTVQRILIKAGLHLKVMVESGEEDKNVTDKIGTMILGHHWDPRKDMLNFKFIFNIEKKVKELKSSQKLNGMKLTELSKAAFTPRLALSLVNSCYDPIGLCAPFLAQYKIALRDITLAGYGWDQLLNNSLQEKWHKLAENLLTLEKIQFKRSVRPENAKGKPSLIGFWDGADSAFLGKVYIKWQTTTHPVINLIACKVRVVPTKGLTTPRSELCGLVLLTRLMDTILSAMQVKPDQIHCLGDSECTISSMESKTAMLNSYFSNRLGEVQDYRDAWSRTGIKVNPLYWIPTNQNPADQGTRENVVAADIGMGTIHQDGMPWMLETPDLWPMSREFLSTTSTVPKEELRSKYKGLYCSNTSTGKDDRVEPEWLYKSNKILLIKGIAARLARVSWTERRETIPMSLSPENYKSGEHLLFLMSMRETSTMMKNMDLTGLSTFTEDGIVWTKGRLGKSMSLILGIEKLAVLNPRSRLAWLIMKHCHNEDHRRDPGDALFRSRKMAWIVKGRNLANDVAKTCLWCKTLANNMKTKTNQQQMGKIPDFKCSYQKPFTNIAVDFLGPFSVKAMNNARSKLKCYPILFCCMVSGAIHIRVASAYSTDAFLTQYQGYCAIRGIPNTVYTDCGSQLIKAAKVNESIGWQEIKNDSAKNGTTWKFAPPGCQFRNGLAEARVKAVKRTLEHLQVRSELDYSQLQVLLERVANIVNERPIGLRYVNKSIGSFIPITPNLLILGHSAVVTPEAKEFTDQNYTRSMKMIAEVETHWWTLWRQQIFPHLLPYTRWSVRCRNLQPGDVCTIKSSTKFSAKKGDYRLCKVADVEIDEQGIVRTVHVLLAKKNNGIVTGYDLVKLRTAAQRLILICPVDQGDDEKELAQIDTPESSRLGINDEMST